jgi:hypothetical protein
VVCETPLLQQRQLYYYYIYYIWKLYYYIIHISRPRVEFGILSLTSLFSVGILILKERIECYSFQRLC